MSSRVNNSEYLRKKLYQFSRNQSRKSKRMNNAQLGSGGSITFMPKLEGILQEVKLQVDFFIIKILTYK